MVKNGITWLNPAPTSIITGVFFAMSYSVAATDVLEATDMTDQVGVGQRDPEQSQTYQHSEEAEEQGQIERAIALRARQLRGDLEQQYAKLRQTLETEDGFSPQLGEDYLGYGMLLRESGEYKEAIKAFVNALHIAKVNNGIYSIKQRPVLKALFDTHFALENMEDYEDYLERILWVEAKNPGVRDQFSYPMLILVGNQYIDQFLRRPFAGDDSVQTLSRAKQHLIAAVRVHGREPVSQLLMPYGELALISFLESKLRPDVDRAALIENSRFRLPGVTDGRMQATSSYVDNSYKRGEIYLQSYLKKALAENDLRHAVRALISLGDFNQLFKKHNVAIQYYVQAWNNAQKLEPDDELREGFNKPVALPAFNYAHDRKPILPTRDSILVPLRLQVDSRGRVEEVALDGSGQQLEDHFSRARRSARRLVFRPQIVGAKAMASVGVTHNSRVYLKK